MSRKKRKNNYIDSTVQGSLLRRIVMHWLIFFFITGFLVIVLQALLGDPAKTLASRLQAEVYEFTFLGIVLISIFPAFLLDTIRFSNRFVGPIARLRRQMRELADGHTPPLKFRDNDFWMEMAGEFNAVRELVESQQQEIESLKSQVNQDAEAQV